MIAENSSTCPKCGGRLRYFDTVKRIVRTKARLTEWLDIRRFRCTDCGSLHRELPDELFPYKQYEAEVIIGVLEGLITCETLGFEDYPCEMTMTRWLAEFSGTVTERRSYYERETADERDREAV